MTSNLALAALPQDRAARFDLYAPVHKGLRAFLGDTLVCLGQMDAADDTSVKAALDQLDELLDHCESHLEKEERHVHPAIESRRTGFTARIAGEHAQHAHAILALRAGADALACAEGSERDAAAAALCRRFAGFVVEAMAPGGSASAIVAGFLDAAFVRFDVAEAAALVSPDFFAHPWAAFGAPPGPAGIAAILPAFAQAFSAAHAEVIDVLADGDRIAARYRYAARHDGPLFGIAPTGRAFEIDGIAILRIDERGRIAEFWRQEDMLTLQRQLGLASMLPEHHVQA